jgi:hypothetical protein
MDKRSESINVWNNTSDVWDFNNQKNGVIGCQRLSGGTISHTTQLFK